mmetsp:Transcript_15033/g.28755  ORF Transcript_15033/g.28755 Transcript_15033/m.28755 type:complete len:375 (-) Transcript_15033:310-1434(-)
MHRPNKQSRKQHSREAAANHSFGGPTQRSSGRQVVVSQEVKSGSHYRRTEQQGKLSEVEKEASDRVYQEGVIFRQSIRIIDVEQLDTKEQQTSCPYEPIMLESGSLVLKEFTGHNDETLQEKTHQKNEENSALRASRMKVVRKKGLWDSKGQNNATQEYEPAVRPVRRKDEGTNKPCHHFQKVHNHIEHGVLAYSLCHGFGAVAHRKCNADVQQKVQPSHKGSHVHDTITIDCVKGRMDRKGSEENDKASDERDKLRRQIRSVKPRRIHGFLEPAVPKDTKVQETTDIHKSFSCHGDTDTRKSCDNYEIEEKIRQGDCFSKTSDSLRTVGHTWQQSWGTPKAAFVPVPFRILIQFYKRSGLIPCPTQLVCELDQ